MQSTRELILRHATELFAERGYAGASVRDIVHAAGVNVSLISYHFGGKEELYRACLVAAGRSRLDVAEQTLAPANSTADLRQRLQTFVTRSLAAIADDFAAHRLVAAELDRGLDGSCDIDPAVEAVFLKVHEVSARFFATAQRDGYIRDDLGPQQLASMLRGLVINEMRMERAKVRLFKQSIHNPTHRAACVRQIVGLVLDGTVIRQAPSADAAGVTRPATEP